MRCNIGINQAEDGYYITLNGLVSDASISKYLGITLELYFEEGIKFNGFIRNGNGLFFKSYNNANNFKVWLRKNMDGFLVAKALAGDL